MEYFTAEKHRIDMKNITIPGRILDIGGGGEGVISRIFGNRVIAIDNRKDELEESPDYGLKIVMDARELKFLDNSIDNVTCFYSLMYMSEADIDKVLAEIYRVLVPAGGLWIWDTCIPCPQAEDIFLAPLEVNLPDETITPTYGISWRRSQSLESMEQKCVATGFTTVKKESAGQGFHLQLCKFS